MKEIKTKNRYWIAAGILNLFTAFLHLIGGQLDLINPLLQSNLINQVQSEMLGVWHMVTIILFATAFIFLKHAFNQKETYSTQLVSFISYLYIAFSIPFIMSGIYKSTIAPQWILLIPIGLLGIFGLRNTRSKN